MKKSILVILAILMCASIAGAYEANYEPYSIPKPPIEPQDNWDYFSTTDVNMLEWDYEGYDTITFGDDILVLNLSTGDIHWRGKLVVTDKELVEALQDVIEGFVCPKCKEKL